MTYKQIETSREVRLWIRDIVVPACTLGAALMAIPEVRQAVSAKANSIRISVEEKFNKRRA